MLTLDDEGGGGGGMVSADKSTVARQQCYKESYEK